MDKKVTALILLLAFVCSGCRIEGHRAETYEFRAGDILVKERCVHAVRHGCGIRLFDCDSKIEYECVTNAMVKK